MTVQAPADWYRDPVGRHDFRYWDGAQWTDHVSSRGLQGLDPVVAASQTPGVSPTQSVAPTVVPVSKRIQRQVRKSGIAADTPAGGGSIFTEPVLVVNQKAKLFEVKTEFAVYDQTGRQIAAVREVGRNLMTKAVGVSSDQNRSYRFQVVDLHGQVLLTMTRPTTILKSKMIIRHPNGTMIGQITQKTLGLLGRVRFNLESDGRVLGSLTAENWDAWDFSIEDANGTEVGRITKTWAGLAREWFTKGDHYVVRIDPSLDHPLRTLVVATALAVDTTLKQDNSSSSRRNW